MVSQIVREKLHTTEAGIMCSPEDLDQKYINYNFNNYIKSVTEEIKENQIKIKNGFIKRFRKK